MKTKNITFDFGGVLIDWNPRYLKKFHLKFFDLSSNDKYHNPKKKISSYFLAFENSARIELMHKLDISELIEN